MARKVKWTVAAWSDLEGVTDYIARDSPHYAAAVVREIRDADPDAINSSDTGRIWQ